MIRELIQLIPPAFRKRGLWIALSLLFRAVLNLVGLAAILPVLALVLDPTWGGVEGNGTLTAIYHATGLRDPRYFAWILCGLVVGVVTLKCLINIWLSQVENRYVMNLYYTLSRQLFTAYHNRGLGFIKNSNSALLTRNVNVVCLAFVGGILKPGAEIIAESLLLILIFTVLVILTPVAALMAVGVFIPSIWLYYSLVRHRMVEFGDMENKAQREKSRLVAETFRGYADVEINGAFPKMLHSFDEAMHRIIDIRMRDSRMKLLPQTFTEIGLAIGMAVLVAVSLGDNANEARLLFGVFAVAALRLMPSIRIILSSWTAIRYNKYTIEILKDAPMGESYTSCDETQGTLPFEHSIEVRDVSFHFDDEEELLFHHLSLHINKGEVLGIKGASGAGKTTLFNLLLGLYTPTEGQILIDSTPLTPQNRHAWQRRIGYVSQNLFLADASFAANVALGVPDKEIDRQRVNEVLEAAQLGEFINSLPKGMDTRIGECGCRLSGGQRQRIGIARALYRRADLLFFDEATSALDSHTEEEVNRAIARLAEQNKAITLIIIAHRETTLDYCHRIITIG